MQSQIPLETCWESLGDGFAAADDTQDPKGVDGCGGAQHYRVVSVGESAGFDGSLFVDSMAGIADSICGRLLTPGEND